MEYGELVLKPCRICRRSFNLVSLERHEKVCQNNRKGSKRTVFKSFLQRSKEINLVPVNNEDEQERIKPREPLPKKSSSSLKVLNNGQSSVKSVSAGYRQCPSCSRHFSDKAADRHITWCLEQKTRLPKTPPNAVALERLQARTKYQAPRPRKKSFMENGTRLVKSAESVRETSHFRTHSSPPVYSNGANLSPLNQHLHKQRETPVQSDFFSPIKNSSSNCSLFCQDNENKKSVKFKDQIPIYTKDRDKNLDMLRALRVHLSQLSVSDDHFNDYVLRSKEQEIYKSSPDIFSLPVVEERSNCRTAQMLAASNNNIDPYPNKPDKELRKPKFCYNCGTKYPIENAKYCCECGIQRLVFGASSPRNFVADCL